MVENYRLYFLPVRKSIIITILLLLTIFHYNNNIFIIKIKVIMNIIKSIDIVLLI